MSENWKTTGVPIITTAGNRGWGIVVRNQEVATQFLRVFNHDWNTDMMDSYAFNLSDTKYGAPPEDFVMSYNVFGGNYRPRFPSKTINSRFTVTPVFCPDSTLDSNGSILEMINSATKSVLIEQLDCNIDWDTKGRKIDNLYLKAAIDAARRGCEVRILLDSAFSYAENPALDNYDTVQYINSIAHKENLIGNLQAKLIYLTGSTGKNSLDKIHNKGIIVDGEKTLVSSINWATGSVVHNRESGVIVENPKVAEFFTEIFNYDWNLSVQEYIEAYVLHSDTRDLIAGEDTEYVISLTNTLMKNLTVSLSISGLENGWKASLDTENIILAPFDSNNSRSYEIRLKITAPNQKFLDQLTNSSKNQIQLESIRTVEIGIRGETEGMATDIVFTTTNLLEKSDAETDSGTEKEKPTDRSIIDPWMVVITIAIVLVISAVIRDFASARMKTKKKKGIRKKQEQPDDEELEE
jgi:hypothetical protein